jgi:hypothetical protein
MIRNVYARCSLVVLFLIAISCTPDVPVMEEKLPEIELEQPLPPGWLVQPDDIINGGPGKDGIQSIDHPKFIDVEEVTFLGDEELVVGVKIGDDIRAYPHRMLDFHELVNDIVGGEPITVTFAPLTGSSLAWSRRIGEQVTTFGSSGLLYHNNLMPYDRATGSLWSQMRLDCINGVAFEQQLPMIPVVETSWKNWKKMFPTSKVLTVNNLWHQNYNGNRYTTYKSDPDYFLYPVGKFSARLPSKERVLGMVVNGKARAFGFSFVARKPDNLLVYNEERNGEPIVFAAQASRNFMVAYSRKLADGTVLQLSAVPNGDDVILKDEEGNRWNIFGEAVRGPRTGEQLPLIQAHVGYWFAWSLFYPDLLVN